MLDHSAIERRIVLDRIVDAPLNADALSRALMPIVRVKWLDGTGADNTRMPFLSGRIVERPVGIGLTLEEIILGIAEELPDFDAFVECGAIYVGTHRVERSLWHRVRPRAGVDVVLTLDLQGPGGTLRTVASLALIVAAIAVSQGAAAPLLAGEGGFTGIWSGVGFLTAGSTSASVASAALLIGGNLSINALTPPPSIPKDNAGTDDATGKSASLSGNLLIPGQTPPRVFGTRRVFPSLACNPLIEYADGNAYAEAVYALGGTHALTQLRAGDVSFTDFDAGEIEYEVREGSRRDATIQSTVTRHSHTRAYGTELTRHVIDKNSPWLLAGSVIDRNNVADTTIARQLPTWQNFTSKAISGDVDEIWLVAVFPEGFGYQDTGAVEDASVPMRIRFRRRGDLVWLNCPEITFTGKALMPRTFQIKFVWDEAPTAGNRLKNVATGGRAASGDKAFSFEGPSFLYGNVPTQNITPGLGGWTTNYYFRSGVSGTQEWFTVGNGNDDTKTRLRNVDMSRDNVIFYLEGGPYTFPKDVYEFQVMLGCPYRANQFSLTDYSYIGADNSGANATGAKYDFFYYTNQPSGVRLPNDQSKFRGRCSIARVSSIINENPLATADFAHIALRVKNRSLDAISVLASGYTYDYDAGPGTWTTLTTTSNPVPHLRDVMVGSYTGRRIPTDLIDDADFVALRQRCVDQNYTVNAVIDGKSAEDARRILVGCCYGQLRQSEKWGVFYERNRSAEGPVQPFSPRNIKGFSFENVIPSRPSGLRVRYDDATDDYKEKELLVFDPYGVSPGNPLEEVRYEGIVTEAAAQARAEFDLKHSYLRQTVYTFESDAEQYVCRRGALIGVTHDILQRYAGFARVRSVVTLGVNTTGITLDASVPTSIGDYFVDPSSFFTSHDFFTDGQMGVLIHCDDGSFIIHEVANSPGAADTLTFVVPFATNPELIPGCHVLTGTLGSIYERMIVLGVTPRSELTAEVTCVPEAPELMAA